jgi:hypothetical protein
MQEISVHYNEIEASDAANVHEGENDGHQTILTTGKSATLLQCQTCEGHEHQYVKANRTEVVCKLSGCSMRLFIG